MIIFYYGTDLWRLRQQVKIMKDRYRAKYTSGINLLVFDFAQQPVGDLRDAIRNVSFFDEVRLCLIANAFHDATIRTNLYNLIQEHDLIKSRETVLLITEATAGPTIKKADSRLYATLANKNTTHTEYAPLAGHTLERWIEQQCATHQRSIEPAAIRELVVRVGPDSWTLANEILKLSNFCSKTITLEAVQALVAAPLQESIFALTDALGDNNRPKAFSLLYQHLAQGSDPYSIFGALVYHVRNMLGTRDAAPAIAVKQLAIHAFAAQKAARQAKRSSQAELTTFYQLCGALDRLAKEGVRNLEDDLFALIVGPEQLPIR